MGIKKRQSQWSVSTPPKCWAGGDELWATTWAARGGSVFAPCIDCTPEYRSAMKAQLRCSRPEVIFVMTEDGDTQGLTADDPRYARVLLGNKLKDVKPISALPAHTAQWHALMKFVEQRAAFVVGRAIKVWLRQAVTG